jgi:hypothetical protein
VFQLKHGVEAVYRYTAAVELLMLLVTFAFRLHGSRYHQPNSSYLRANSLSLTSTRAGSGSGNSISESATPNLEEWALLSILAGAGVCEEDTYGVKVRTFIDGTYLNVVSLVG